MKFPPSQLAWEVPDDMRGHVIIAGYDAIAAGLIERLAAAHDSPFGTELVMLGSQEQRAAFREAFGTN
jgi:hypothetical protein